MTRLMNGVMGALVALVMPLSRASAEDRPKIAVIPKGTTHAFWKSV